MTWPLSLHVTASKGNAKWRSRPIPTRYTAANNVREDLVNCLPARPEKTPIVSAAGRDKAAQTLHEWSRDALRAPNADNAAIDGDDATASAKTPPNRVGNYCQIFQDTVSVSVVLTWWTRPARRPDGLPEGQDVQGAAARHRGDGGVQERRRSRFWCGCCQSAGLGVLIYTNASHGAGGSIVAHTSGVASTAMTAGTGRALDINICQTVIQGTYTSAGMVPRNVFFSPTSKALASGFTGIAQNRYEVKGARTRAPSWPVQTCSCPTSARSRTHRTT